MKKEHLFCIEGDSKCVEYTNRLITFAQVQDRITIVHSSAADVATWYSTYIQQPINFLFIDHHKNSYYCDLKSIIDHNCLDHQCTVVADNVLCLNKPLTEYLTFVRDESGPFLSSRLYEGYLEYTTNEDRMTSDMIDGIEVSIFR
jgi:predicted O-methyltransferase YrrM